MDVRRQPIDEGLLRTADLAAMPDFILGGVVVSPSTRKLRGPTGIADVEPRVMQVLVVLADAIGEVVTRETLFNRCWGGVPVGDDSLNRAVGALRKTAAAVGGRFEIETIPRTGYRLLAGNASATPAMDSAPGPRPFSRREIAGGALGIAMLAGAGAWAGLNSVRERRFDRLLREGTDALWDDNQFDPVKARRLFEEAQRIDPGDPRALGLLSLAQTYFAVTAKPEASLAAVALAGKNAQRALAANPREPSALLTMYLLQGSTRDWLSRDKQLRQILAIDPANQGAINELVLMLQAAGYSRESWNWNERGVQLQPLSQNFLGKRALKLWIFGRVAESDKVIDQLRSLFPASPFPWWVRFALYALTGRPLAAKAMLNKRPATFDASSAALWEPALAALTSRSAPDIETARRACEAGARASGDRAGDGVMIMSALGDVDAAFDIANGFLLSRGTVVRQSGTPQSDREDAYERINTQWLFTPPCAVMRADARFSSLCEGIGLSEYWRARGVPPDYRRFADQDRLNS